MEELPIKNFIEKVASPSPTPGGGSIAALAGAIACSLAEMVCNLTIGKKKYADVEEEMKEFLNVFKKARKKFLNLVNEDALAFDEVMKAFKEKKDIEKSFKKAANVPYKTAKNCIDLMDGIKKIAEKGNKNSISDAGVSALMMKTAFKSAVMNIKINLKSLKDEEYKKEMEEKIKNMENGMEVKFNEIMKIVNKWLD